MKIVWSFILLLALMSTQSMASKKFSCVEIATNLTAAHSSYRNVKVQAIRNAKELSLSSQDAVREYRALFEYLTKVFRFIPDSSAWPGRLIGQIEDIDLYLYSPEDGAGPWNSSPDAIYLARESLMSTGEYEAIAMTLKQLYGVDQNLLTQDEVMNDLRLLPRDAQVQLLRLKARAAHFLEALEGKHNYGSKYLAYRYHNLKNFILKEGAIPFEFLAYKLQALSEGYIEAQFVEGYSGGLKDVPGIASFSGSELARSPLEFRAIIQVTNQLKTDGRINYATYPEGDAALLDAYRELGFVTYSLPGPKQEFRGKEYEFPRHFAIVQGTLLGSYGEVGWRTDRAIFPKVISDVRRVETTSDYGIDEGTTYVEYRYHYPDIPKIEMNTNLNINDGQRPLLVFIKPKD